MLRKLILVSAAVLIALAGCRGRTHASASGNITEADAALLTLPAVPSMLGMGPERNIYLLEHYWKGLSWDDTASIGTDAMNQVFADWLSLLYSVPEADAAQLSHHIISDGTGHPGMQLALYGLTESALNDPNSQLRNEELFYPVIEAISNDSLIDDVLKTRPRHLLEQLGKNRKGTVAQNLIVTQIDGSQINLSSWIKSDKERQYTLLYFFNPDCHDCERVGTILRTDSLIDSLTSIGLLRIAAIYPDEDLTSWNAHKADAYPEKWLTGRLATASERSKYYLPAIPNLYLLDADRRILLKDAPIESILEFLASHTRTALARGSL